jgi:D-alanine transaminase
MCSSTKEVLPIVELDGARVGACPPAKRNPGQTESGTPGPLFAAMYAWYQEFKATVMRGA